MRSRPTIHSPYSQDDGEYPDLEFTETEQEQLQQLQPHLMLAGELQETAVPYISQTILQSAIEWFAKELIEIVETYGPEKVIVTSNIEGATWFWRRLRAALIHQAYPPDILTAKTIRVTTNTGFKTFKPEVNQAKLKWLAPEELQDKILVSLDDIGDSGFTQAAIAELALKDGAQEVITVNLLEKLLPAPAKKLHQPDYALLISKHAFLIGGGLDSGTTEAEREKLFRNLNLIAVLEQQLITERDSLLATTPEGLPLPNHLH